MSMTNYLSLASSAVNDSAIVLAQNAVDVVSDAAGKGGFAAKATLGQLIEFQFTGLLVVFTVLGGLTIMCVVMAWLIKTLAPDQYYCKKTTPVAPPAPTAAVAAPAAAQAVTVHPGLGDEELIAILAVAATEVLGQAVSVVKFRTMDSMDWTWSVQGRVNLHSLHKL